LSSARADDNGGVNRRLGSVDALRGLVMIIMALDHVRDFLHRGAMSASPTDLRVTTAALFATRWVTHLCAPVFMLTAGLGAFFYWRTRQRSKGQLAWFLATRGLWLIALELTVMQLAYNFDVGRSYPIFLLVLWVLGACMMVLAVLVWLPHAVLLVLSVAMIVLHHLADGVGAQSFGAWAPLWNLVHQVGAFPFAGRVFIAAYPLVPWIGVMSLGFCLGPILLRSEHWSGPDHPFGRANFGVRPLSSLSSRRMLIVIGGAMTAGFLALRALNIYGDPVPWSPQATAELTVLSFLNTTKYPPSLAFVLMTLGPALLILAGFESLSFSRRNPLIVFGRVPLFYFVLHFVAAHAAAVLLAVFSYGSSAWTFMLQPVPSMGGPSAAFPPNFGYDLWVTYVAWIVIVAGLYPLCAWFARYKEQHRHWWLSYL
jgi:uncharacterized membrane protein